MNKFKIGNIVTYNCKPHAVMGIYDGYIILHNNDDKSFYHVVTLVQGEMDYKKLKLHLPEILKKL